METPESFIEATGIQKLRDAYADKEDGKKLKQKTKDAKTAKMGKIDIDYRSCTTRSSSIRRSRA